MTYFPATYLLSFMIALIAAIIITPATKRLALKRGWLDDPSRSSRLVHGRPIPRIGGLAVIIAFFMPLSGLVIINKGSVGTQFTSDFDKVLGLFIGGIAIALVGLFDDVKGLRARYKFALQTLVAAGMYFAGYKIQSISIPLFGIIQFGDFGIIVTILWIVGIVNSINLIDGLDGLAAGIGFFVCLTNFIIGYLTGNIIICLISGTLGGALIGFLFFNFNPATIFLGDTGSMFIGFVLAVSSIWANIKMGTTVGMLIPIVALGLPIMDTSLAILRRRLKGLPIFAPDRGHMHHRLIDKGLSHRGAVLVLYSITFTLMILAILIHVGNSLILGTALAVFSLFIIGSVHIMGGFNFLFHHVPQRKWAFSKHAELFRTYVPKSIFALSSAKQWPELEAVLKNFIKKSQISDVELFDGNKRSIWHFNLDDPGKQNQSEVSIVYPLIKHSNPVIDNISLSYRREKELLLATLVIKFSWRSEMGIVTTQSDMLLQLVVDALSINIDVIKAALIDKK